MKQAVLYVDSQEAALKESGDVLLSGVSPSSCWAAIHLASPGSQGFINLPFHLVLQTSVTHTSLGGERA